jgi:hypothetical protein
MGAAGSGDKESAAIRTDVAYRFSIFETLIDYGNVQDELRLETDLETVFDAHQQNVPTLCLRISDPLACIFALKRSTKHRTKVSLAVKCPPLFSWHSLSPESVRPQC